MIQMRVRVSQMRHILSLNGKGGNYVGEKEEGGGGGGAEEEGMGEAGGGGGGMVQREEEEKTEKCQYSLLTESKVSVSQVNIYVYIFIVHEQYVYSMYIHVHDNISITHMSYYIMQWYVLLYIYHKVREYFVYRDDHGPIAS